jgi:hypothetical protein
VAEPVEIRWLSLSKPALTFGYFVSRQSDKKEFKHRRLSGLQTAQQLQDNSLQPLCKAKATRRKSTIQFHFNY